MNTHNCGSNEKCINSPGSFLCECKPGYSGNGTFCEGFIWFFEIWKMKYEKIKI